jgi:nucleoside-diphosphate-sugar epimerase
VNHATVLGASGFIGSHLSAELERRGLDVATPARDADLAGRDLGTVFYCVGLTGDARRRPLDTVEAHVGKLSEVLGGCRFDRLLYLSSTRLYLGAPTGREDQTLRDDPGDGGRIFNLSKETGEALVLQGRGAGPIARLSNVYGPDWKSENFLTEIVTAACRDGAVSIRDAPNSAKDYVHVDDVVQSLIGIASNGEGVYNVASGRNVSHRELADALTAATGCEIEFAAGGEAVTFPPIETSRLQSEFPFSPRSVLEDLPELVESCREQLRARRP